MSALSHAVLQTNKTSILVVEDDHLLNNQMTEMLYGYGYRVTQCFDGEEALNLATSTTFNLILLDVMLPGRDGLSVLTILRKTNSTPVIIVSAKHAEEERIRGLSAGADDFLAKPFNSKELMLRMDAVLRRTLRIVTQEKNVLELDRLKLDRRHQTVQIDQTFLTFTPTEFGLLWILVQNRNEVLTKAYLCQAVLNRSYSIYDRSLDMHLSRVRRKLSQSGWEGTRLQTVHGKGYVIK